MMTLVSAGRTSTAHCKLGVAVAHLQAAIAHINNDAQVRVTADPNQSGEIAELRLVVCALADIIASLQARRANTARAA